MAGKADIVDAVVAQNDEITKQQASEIFDSVFGAITDTLESGERVQIPAFGSFNVSERAERQGRNPQTGEPLTIPASKSVRFKPGKDLKDAVNS